MSWRQHLGDAKSSVVPGDVVSVFRDNDTQTYRIFANKGWENVPEHGPSAHRFESCECCDFSIEDLRQLQGIIDAAIRQHEPWPNYDEA